MDPRNRLEAETKGVHPQNVRNESSLADSIYLEEMLKLNRKCIG